MGGGGSQTIEQTFNLSAVNKSIFTQMTKNTNTLATSMNNIQQLEVNLGVMKSGCTATLGQTIDATSTSVGQLDATMIAETKDQVQASMQAAANASLEKATEAGNFQFGDKQNVKTEVNMAIEGWCRCSENKGLSDLVGTLFEGLTGPMKYGIIASVVCCCLLVLVMIVIGLSPAGQSATKNLGAAGAARFGGMRPRSFNYY
jgi:hypothetical protein